MTYAAAVDPRIAAILEQRRRQGVEIRRTIPATPLSVPAAVPETPSVPTQTDPPATVPVTDTELAAILARLLPAADALIREAIAALRSDGRLTVAEALGLAPELRNIVAEVVGSLAPAIKGTSARELVILVMSALLVQYVSPYLPALLRPYLTAQTLRTLVGGLEYAYQTWVKPRLKKAA